MKIRTWDGAVPAPGTLLRDIGLAEPDFQMFTSSMQVDPDHPDTIRMIGSSTERDMQGDTMTVNALADMTNAPVGLTIFLNHDYTLPGSLFGSLVEQPKLVQQGGIADIHIACDYEKSNPAAAQTYGYIKNGRRLGCSVGCMVLEYEIDEENDDGRSWWPPIIITSVLTMEWSVVGIPANQRCWVEQGLKGLFTRTFDKRLAAAVKGLYPRQYSDIIEGCPDAALRRDLARVVARPTSPSRMEWVPLSKTFVMNTKGRIHEVGRDLVGTAVATQQVLLNNLKMAGGGAGSDASWRRRAAASEEQQQAEPDVTKGACGKTTWPLADRNAAWDSGEAHARLVEWAGGADDFSVAKLKQVHFWCAEDAEKLGDFKLPFCDVVDGDVKAIPHAIFSVAGVLQGSMGGADIPDEDADAVKKKVETYYNRMADEFNDTDIKVPWADDDGKEKAGAPAMAGSVASLRSESAGAHSPGTPAAPTTETKGHPTMGDKVATLDETQRLILKQMNQAGAALGLPAVTMKEDGSFVYAAGAPVAEDAWAEAMIERVLGKMFEIEKAGATFSKENMAHLCAIHKCLHKMTEGKICAMDEALSGEGDDDDHSDPDGDGDNDDSDQKGMQAFIEATIKSTVALYMAPIAQGLGEVNTSLAGLGTRSLEQSVGVAQAQLVGLMRKIAGAEEQIAQTARNAAALYDMPVGRPTAVTRSTHEAENGTAAPGTVSREELLRLAAAPATGQNGTWDGTLEMARRQCRYEELDAGGYKIKYRVWPAGVGGSVAKGVRPALTTDEKSLMRPAWILAYQEGGEASVPLLSLGEINEADTALAAAAAAQQQSAV